MCLILRRMELMDKLKKRQEEEIDKINRTVSEAADANKTVVDKLNGVAKFQKQLRGR